MIGAAGADSSADITPGAYRDLGGGIRPVDAARLLTVNFTDLPPSACWVHHGLREGFEVAFFTGTEGMRRVEGSTCGLQDGESWTVSYALDLDASWRTRAARVRSRTVTGEAEVALESEGDGRWLVDGKVRTELDGCLDVDMESSAFTNALPMRRLRLGVGRRAEAPAAYVRASSLVVERLQQTYVCVDQGVACAQFDYEAPGFAFSCRLVYDRSGLVLEYPGIASRAA
jgi:uncharacterized protein